ncbi:hypothetical protein CASFOL_010044 [Castilleja foliolosa]|uniref:Uncharacterized protein n=1 Tax=Castilleja foliolosa TaxID=1961234 RepID=A0ABD3DSJ2_9LAMI
MAQNGYDGLELQNLGDKQAKERFGSRVQQPRPHRIISSPSVEMNSPTPRPFQAQRQCKSSPMPHRRNQSKWDCFRPGMQAVFLGSGPKTCGTGVFIPQTQGTAHQFSRKPPFSPVLLPVRVVKALNLNVHELNRQIKPQPEPGKNVAKKDEKLEKKKEEDDVIYIAPDIILPKEWTY